MVPVPLCKEAQMAPEIDMKVPWLQTGRMTREDLSGVHAWFYVKRGHYGRQYAGMLWNEETNRKPAKDEHTLYRIKVTWK
jgi:hypothetical protein